MKNKINVNISPNPLDLQTLHCSQNDTGERKFYFTLHNNGEVIDTTDISDPIFEPFSVYKGGTEQLLPVNTDDPTTSPIIADIQYPDEEKTEQEFTYRESPTTLDGNAIIEKLYGNTLVWNQLIQNGNFADTSIWLATGSNTLSVNSNIGTLNCVDPLGVLYQPIDFKSGHKYLYYETVKADSTIPVFLITVGGQIQIASATIGASWSDISGIFNYETSWSAINFNAIRIPSGATGHTVDIRNCMLFDLTAMFGSTKADEIYAMEQSQSGSGVAYFRSLFPLPYYQYGQKLLPFKGEGIKTTGFNLFDKSVVTNQWFNDAHGTITPVTSGFKLSDYIRVIPNEQYYHSIAGSIRWLSFDANKNLIDTGAWFSPVGMAFGASAGVFTVPSNVYYIRGTITDAYLDSFIVNISSDKDGTYESYKSSTTSIPTLTYFPTGMKSAGNVYDELTNSKAITRIGEVDLGDLEWTYTNVEGHLRFVSSSMNPEAKTPDVIANAICSKYEIVNEGQVYNNTKVGLCMITNSRAMVYDPNYTDAQTFTTAMSGIYLQYELKDEEVTAFTHASLICEDGESNLYQDDDLLVCECTEDFSKDSGFKDCKIKFTNDDGVVYSNKIQLHIERKP